MPSLIPVVSLNLASVTPAGAVADFSTAKRNVSMVMVVNGEVSGGQVAVQASHDNVNWVAPPGKDGGIDILAHTDPLGTRPPRIKVQVKRQGQAVNCDGLRSFMAVLGDDDVGLFVSTGGFTKDAAAEARTQEKRKITLLTLEALFDLWVEHYARLTDAARRRLPLKPIHFLEPTS